ncbi:hypothetical protein HDK64DRAFT_258779 [Phyllosticta capitalensis]
MSHPIEYMDMEHHPQGGWTTLHRVDVFEADWENNLPEQNGPLAGHLQCLLGILIHNRAALRYGEDRPLRYGLRNHSFGVRSRPRCIRVYRALKRYHPASGAPQEIAQLPVPGGPELPDWVKEECETLEFRLYYWDEDDDTPLHANFAPLEVWIPWKVNNDTKRQALWFYRMPQGTRMPRGRFNHSPSTG